MRIKPSIAAKSIWMGILILSIFFGKSLAQNSTPYFMLWGNADQTTCSSYVLQYTTFDIYIFLTPGDQGAITTEFRLDHPPNHISTADESAPFVLISSIVGAPFGSPGVSATFNSCLIETSWIWKVTCMSFDLNFGYYYVDLNEDTGRLVVSSCIGGNSIIDAKCYGDFGYRSPGICEMATKESTWSTIKELYR